MDNLNILENVNLEKEIENLYETMKKNNSFLYLNEDNIDEEDGHLYDLMFFENNDFTRSIYKSKFENWESFKVRFIRNEKQNIKIRENNKKIFIVNNLEELNLKLDELKIEKEVTLRIGKVIDDFIKNGTILKFMRNSLKLEEEDLKNEFIVYFYGKDGEEGFLTYGFSLKS